jgi:hypothetical protein
MSERFDKWQEKIELCKGTRQSFPIQLDWSNPDDVELIKVIAFLKDNDEFSEVIRKALRIIPALIFSGSLDELFAEFAWVKAEFLQYMREVAIEVPIGQSPETPTAPEHKHIEAERAWLDAEQERLEQERAWQERRLAEAQKALEAERRNIEQERQRIEAERTEHQTSIQKQLARMEALLLSQGHQPIERPIEQQSHHPNEVNNRPGRPKQLVVPQFTAPPSVDDEDDEDLLESKKDESAAMRTTQNFLRNVKGLMTETKQPPKTNGSYSTGGKRRYKQNREVGQ